MQALKLESQYEVPPRPLQIPFQLEQLAAEADSAEASANEAKITSANVSFMFSIHSSGWEDSQRDTHEG
jgi:hypothetical protein